MSDKHTKKLSGFLGDGNEAKAKDDSLLSSLSTSDKKVTAGLAGLQAGQAFTGDDFESGALATLGGIGTGALAGFASGAGPMGAVVGGVAGGLTALINSYLSTKKSNEARRREDKLIAEIKAEQRRKENLNRADQAQLLKFKRSDIEFGRKVDALTAKRNLLSGVLSQNQNLKDRFITTGVV